ncbi:MerR family transcriptional regulator [Ktedonosporobacter rubrisoli]|nr:MerR family transcriptional regulator [Ktedonosporobacter rubrisoli]
MLKIRDFARLAEVSMTTLRYYDEIGLLKPIRVDPETGYRYYTMDQLPHLHRILAFKELGLELTQIAELLNEGVSPEALQGMLRLRQAEVQQRIQAEQEQLVRIEARLRSLEQGGGLPAYEVVLKAVRPITAVSLGLTATDLAYQAHWADALDAMLKRCGITPVDHMLIIHGEYGDDGMPTSVEALAPVDERDADTLVTNSEGRLRRCILPAVPHVASTLHYGHPARVFSAYRALGTWMESNGYTIVGPRRKIRLRRGDNLDEALTEIQFPVEKAA